MCNHPVIKWHEIAQTFSEVDYVRKVIAKKHCKYGEYGSFEHSALLVLI